MKKNIGTTDRIIRIIVAAALGALAAAKVITGLWATIAIVAAVILAFTAVIGWCGIYAVLGMSTACCGGSSDGKDGCCCGHKEEH